MFGPSQAAEAFRPGIIWPSFFSRPVNNMSHFPKNMKAIIMHERCHAITRRRGLNRRCKHITLRSIYCWQHEKKIEGLRVMKSQLPGAGKGVFTTKPIKKGAKICGYTGDIVVNYDPDYGNPYALKVKERPPTYIDARRSNEAVGRFVNDGRGEIPSNSILIWDPDEKQGWVEATRDIGPGEEILTDYGEEYWRDIPKMPNISKRRKEMAKRELQPHPVKEVEALQETDSDDSDWLPSDEEEEQPPKKAPPKKRGPVDKNLRLAKNLYARLHVIKGLFSDKSAVELNLPLTKKTVAIPERNGEDGFDWAERLMKTTTKAEKDLLEWFRRKYPQITRAKLLDTIDTLYKRDKNRQARLRRKAAKS